VNGPPRDGYLDRLVFRRLSRRLTDRLLRTPASPNAVTVLGIACGVTGGLAVALPWAFAGALAAALLVASAVLDCADGELARLRHAESRLGHVLDVIGDTAVHVALFSGIALALRHGGGFPQRPTIVALAAGVAGAFVAITWSETTDERRRRVACWENRLLDVVLSPLSTRDWYVFPLAFALAGRLDALIVGAAVGAHVFWAAVVVLVVRVLRRAPAREASRGDEAHVQGNEARVDQ
jgi:phosphatidylglycerophosphate synthase